MTLRDYLHFKKITLNEFAKKVGFNRSYLSLIKTGKLKPSMKLARMIEQATDGEVTVLELVL